jgi:hypothetical protein
MELYENGVLNEREARRVVSVALERGWATRGGRRVSVETARGDARPTGMDDEDRARATFLQRLADSPVEIQDHELDFLSETMSRPWGEWTDIQRQAIDALRDAYEGWI